MSSDKYAQHLIQKYKLAVAIAVIQTNPESKSLDQHLIDLKNKFNDEKMDDDITICSDDYDVDFNDFNDNDVSRNSDTILNDFNDVKILNKSMENKNKHVFPDVTDLAGNIIREKTQDQANNDDIQSTFCETQTQLYTCLAPNSLTDIDKTICDSIARIHHDNIMDIDKACDNIDKIYKTQNNTNRTTCRSIDEVIKIKNDQTYVNRSEINRDILTNKEDFNNSQRNNVIPNIKDTIDGTIAFDSQATELYTIQGLTENYTHVSQSQNHNFDVSGKYIKGVNNNINIQGINENMNDTSVHTSTDFSCHLKDSNMARKIERNLEKVNIMEEVTHNFDQNTQTAIDYREYTQTQVPCIAVVYDSENFLPNNIKDAKLVKKICDNLEQDKVNYMEKEDFARNSQITYKDGINHNDLQENQFILTPAIGNTQNFTQDIFDVAQIKNTDQCETQNTTASNEIPKNNTEMMTMQVFDYSRRVQNESRAINKVSINAAHDSETEEVSQTEMVPFKVIEELNRVKAYLCKNERRMGNESSLDSGYRSDSQGRRSGFQLSGNWMGQSGYCLFDHLAKCPLVAASEDIVAEISKVLGQLIDILHEQESYPSFLEELLSYVESLISSVFTEEDMVLDKDEKIQRLFLLNKSIHIQKYSLEKLTDILENVHAHLTNKEELYELTNINNIENLSYIFHILEVILKKSLKNKKIDNSQNRSQETEKYPKKSSITDIWRKKWNPNYKEESKIECSLEKKCVFKKCNEVLNKIVVGCMDGYSLVAFAALQCFNTLQS